MGTLAAKQKPVLPDGRAARALEINGKKTFNQMEMFTLVNRLLPAHETIMNVIDHDRFIQSGIYKAVNTNGWWRTGRYGVYARGFEKEFDKPVGDKVVWIEEINGQKLDFPFEVPDVPHPSVIGKGLREATGMLDFDIRKLNYNEGTRTVSVSSDFNPKTDVAVRDVMRPRNWALVDADGYPLRSSLSDLENSEARFMRVRHSDEFEDNATGWHASVAHVVYDFGYDGRRGVDADFDWSYDSGVAVVERKDAVPQISLAEEKLVKIADPKALLKRAEQLEALAEDFAKRFEGMLTAEMHQRFVTEPLETAKILREVAGKIETAKGQ